tara:strand:- start:757 stop:1584 length:828 start_codon:yes stop_codon:yes gene_type:complete
MGDQTTDKTRKKGIRATPSTRKLARTLNIDINSLPTSDPHRTITKEDIRAAANLSPETTPPHKQPSSPSQPHTTTTIHPKKDEQSIKELITLYDEADITDLLQIENKQTHSKQENDPFPDLLPYIIKSFNLALQKTITTPIHHPNTVAVFSLANPSQDITLTEIDEKNIIDIQNQLTKTNNPQTGPLPAIRIIQLPKIGQEITTPQPQTTNSLLLSVGRVREQTETKKGREDIRIKISLAFTAYITFIAEQEAKACITKLKNYLQDPHLLLVEMI